MITFVGLTTIHAVGMAQYVYHWDNSIAWQKACNVGDNPNTTEWDPDEQLLEEATLAELGGDDMMNHVKGALLSWMPWIYVLVTLGRIERLLSASKSGNDAQYLKGLFKLARPIAVVKMVVMPVVGLVASYFQIQMVKYDRFEYMHAMLDCL